MRVMAAIAISFDCILIGIPVKLIAINLDRVLMSILSNQLQSSWIVYQWMLMVVSMLGSMVGSTVGPTWLCRAINLSRAFNTSDERLLWLSAKRV
jgi:hypothetical protein